MQTILKSDRSGSFKSFNIFFNNDFLPVLKKGLVNFIVILAVIFISRFVSHWLGISTQISLDFIDLILAIAGSFIQVLIYLLKKYTIKKS